ncbi:SDR family NAD(P)-dependent oxidoreductase [Mucilaginibacter rubeus]|uniref:SDR family NAD(P)-dependent oxidoreductase n=1 Tax=Mucilaginibacter rubeus TaxID=2027860 RepID=A0AAE6MJ16_9SPHI|nr:MULTISPECIES: SDR family NAD(P)-dependent oxidoreductase [Mucilaginibacter]QEM05193.1 SDR family NAD(P)-dependent oxidoreductase [Mucilaginibacter rubeus]QEM17787.1 SDR family NAD(P)-dependent oxidoreductase [Mucilaginibacter gossypii]QTE45687.1 SDR family NAD(P)-dependent oxidoreductase [Mucilaginibacter rubeus]QTE52284.1 SDR family NAD(P)-dependent oxidoreductase [Mucilaginibacter rubeus]QTE57371.1 SDR family NAD(P)-dependent oxidoreductase [Mucilaginibacter rubeus]
MKTQKVWFVTGASKGLGLSLVKRLLTQGYKVAATSREAEALRTEVGYSGDDFLPLQVNLTDNTSVAEVITAIVAKFGTIDVVVNNAGYGQLGTLEELTDDEARKNFDVNVFGSLNVIRNVMPIFRARKSGAFFNISSIAGFLGTFPGWGIYNATKFAVAGFTEALSAEAKSLGVTATIVYPGYFKTNFLLQGSLRTAAKPINDYKEARDLEVIHNEQVIGNQPGDPENAALAFIEVAEMQERPLHLFLGSDSLGMAQNKIEAIQKDLAAFESISKSTDFRK